MLKYRRDIDGLRALAVIPVIFFHAGFNAFSGGYVGVDIFFVISGFLITKIILHDIECNQFSILHFYERRARRILPALFFVVISSIPIAYLFLIPDDLKNFGQSLVGVSIFASNFLFWLESGYFGGASELKPLIHTWSLAVEEQYYIFFPLLLMCIYSLNKKIIFFIFSTLFLLSFIAANVITMSPNNSDLTSAAFYLLPFRAWELLLGVFCAYADKNKVPRENNFMTEALPLLGLFLIVFSIVGYDSTTPFPSIYTLLPTIGTVLIIQGNKNTFIYKILSLKLLVGIGLISYSLYLWHQPIFAYAKHINLYELHEVTFIPLIFLSIIMAYISWKFIEKPYRVKNKIAPKTVLLHSLIGISIIGGCGIYIHLSNGIESRAPDYLTNHNQINEVCYFDGYSDEFIQNTEIKSCLSKPNSILLIGDSHARSLSNGLSDQLYVEGFNLITITEKGCLPVKGISNNKEDDSCKNYKDFIYQIIESQNHTILMSARWRWHIKGTRYDNGEGGVEEGHSMNPFVENNSKSIEKYLTDELLRLSRKKSIILIGPIPEVGLNVLKYEFKNRNKAQASLTHSYDNFLKANYDFFHALDSHEEIHIVRPDEIACNQVNRRCATKIDSEILYYDTDHPTDYFAELIGKEVLKYLD